MGYPQLMSRRLFLCLLGMFMLTAAAGAQEIRILPIATRDLVYDPFSKRIYAGTTAGAGNGDGQVVAIDPWTGAIGPRVAVGGEPGKLALSDDGRYLYVALDGAGAVRRVDLGAQTAGLQFSLGNNESIG